MSAGNRAAQQSARYYGSRASSEAFNESVAFFQKGHNGNT